MKQKLILVFLALLMTAAITYQSRTTTQTWKLDAPDVLDQMDAISGKWEVITPEKLSQPVMTQSVKYADFPKALFRDHDFYDFDSSVKLYISSENTDTQSAGLVLRYRNLYSFYMLFLNTKDKRVTLTRAGLSGLKVVKRVNHDFQPDRWYELKASCNLNHFKIFVDNELVLEAEDSVSTGGKIGLVTAGTSRVYFSDLQVNSETIEAEKK
jgi:hypothetical protein